MDNVVLNGVVAELAGVLPGRRLERVEQSREGDLILDFGRGVRLRIATGPGRSRLHLLRGHPPLAETPQPFTARLSREAVGARIEQITKDPEERVISLFLRSPDGERRLVAELLGRSSNLLWLNQDGRIQAFARTLKSEFRAPVPGEPYQPPPTLKSAGVLSLAPADLEQLARSAGGVGGDFVRLLVREVRGLGSMLAREIEHRVREGQEDLAAVWGGIVSRLQGGRFEPHLYSPCDPDEIEEHLALETDRFFVAPWPLASASHLVARRFESFSEALELHGRLADRWKEFDTERRSLASSFETETRRLRRLQEALERDLERAQQGDQYRVWGEILLREKDSLRIEGSTVTVLDRYGGGQELSIPVDPALSIGQNAERMFHRYRRARRSVPHIEKRMQEITKRLGGLGPVQNQVRTARTLRKVRVLAERWKLAPRGVSSERTLRAGAGERGPEARAREFRSSEGWTILVGRGARANDRLTFGVSAPHDFWMHAAGSPGAHVVVRNPSRKPQIPPRTLKEAAALAAFFSKARGGGAVDVHYTQRRYVRRPRGAPPGQVLVKRFRTVRVEPRPPAQNSAQSGPPDR